MISILLLVVGIIKLACNIKKTKNKPLLFITSFTPYLIIGILPKYFITEMMWLYCLNGGKINQTLINALHTVPTKIQPWQIQIINYGAIINLLILSITIMCIVFLAISYENNKKEKKQKK